MATNADPNAPLNANVGAVLKEIASKGEAFSQKEPGARESLIASARSLIAALETPMETVLWMIWAEPARNLASRLAIDLGVFEKLAEDGGRPKSASELASVTGADPKLLARVVRHLASMGMISETAPDTYAPTALSRILAVPKYRDGITFCFDCPGPSFQKMPEYLASIKYQNPEDTMKGSFQYAHNIDYHGWVWMSERPKIMQAFQSYMSGHRLDRPSWIDPDFYPVAERLEAGLKTEGDSGAIVDVGGSVGHDLQAFKVKHPHFQGRLILQDLPQVVPLVAGLDPAIEVTAHDFFTPQPVKGVRAYFMHSVLHDWPDERCLIILKNLKDAMQPGYSKILVCEAVLPDVGASWQHTSLDLFMMALASSQERTETQWRKLFHAAGLRVMGIWTKGTGNESLIELELL